MILEILSISLSNFIQAPWVSLDKEALDGKLEKVQKLDKYLRGQICLTQFKHYTMYT
jgi:hypothetical protein